MNLTFPTALDYRHDNKAAALSTAECVPANLSLWQAGNGLQDRFAPDDGNLEAECNPMIFNLFRKDTATEPVYAVYRSIVAQSRQPFFYADWQVPDTVTGRFDMISLHLALLFRRLRAGNQAQKDFSQAVFDLFFKDMDRSLREMGVGDLGVPKRIQKMGNVFFGLLAAMNEAMDRDDVDGLQAVLSRNIFQGEDGPHVAALAQYIMAGDRGLAAQITGNITNGQINFEVAA
jgi:cytochrome b pre-mRNA-processing protein 3